MTNLIEKEDDIIFIVPKWGQKVVLVVRAAQIERLAGGRAEQDFYRTTDKKEIARYRTALENATLIHEGGGMRDFEAANGCKIYQSFFQNDWALFSISTEVS